MDIEGSAAGTAAGRVFAPDSPLVFASHDRDSLKRYCKRFFKLEHGQVTEIASDEI